MSLGVRLTSKFNWKEHCDRISNKANRSLGLVKRTLKPCNPEVKERAYKALIRPLLEYASAAWNPHTNRDTETIEKVQRRAASFVAHDYKRSTNSQDLVHQLGWDSLESRRLLAQVTLFFKIKNNLIDLEFPSSIQPAPRSRIQHTMLQPYPSVLAMWDIQNMKTPNHLSLNYLLSLFLLVFIFSLCIIVSYLN